jgi:hypothetical protein
MAKKIPDAVLQLNLENIAEFGNQIHLVSQEPGEYSSLATYGLGSASLTTGVSGGDYTIGDGDTSGRKLTLNSIAIIGSHPGTADHVAIVYSGGSLLKAITTISAFSVASGTSYTLSTFDILEVRDPS